MKNILSIDPGNAKSAYVIWNGKTISDKNKISNEELNYNLHSNLLSDNGIKEAIIEMISSYGMQVGQSIFDCCVWVGIFKETLESKGIIVHLVFRKTVKMHHCHALRKVNDAAVNQVLRDKYGEDDTKKRPNELYKTPNGTWMNGDIWAAFALATYWTEPKDSPVKNEKEMEKNKLTPNLL